MSDDIVDVLRSMAAAYPEDIFPVPPPDKRARDGAAAHVLRTIAVPHFTAAADEIERLRAWKSEATEVIGSWEQVWEALGRPGRLGEAKAAAVLRAVEALKARALSEDRCICSIDWDERCPEHGTAIWRRDEPCEYCGSFGAHFCSSNPVPLESWAEGKGAQP